MVQHATYTVVSLQSNMKAMLFVPQLVSSYRISYTHWLTLSAECLKRRATCLFTAKEKPRVKDCIWVESVLRVCMHRVMQYCSKHSRKNFWTRNRGVTRVVFGVFTRSLGGSGGMLPQKKFEIYDSST